MEAPCPEIEVFHDLTQDRSTSMTDQAISPLRRRMIEDMTIRKFVAKTQHDYVQRVKDFAVFLGRSPSTASKEDVRRFQLHLASNGAGTPKMNVTAAALRFFFNVTLDRPDLAKQASFVHEPRKVPVVLSPEEVARFLEAAPGIKYKAALSVAYGAGLRVSEVAALKVTDIDSERMMLRVEQGKGSEQGRDLRPAVQGIIRDPADNRRRSQAPRRPHRHLVRPPYLGFGADPSSTRAHDRAGRRVLARRQPMGLMPTELLPSRACAVAIVPAAVPAQAHRRSSDRRAAVLRRARRAQRPQSLRLAPLRNSEWVVYSKRPFGGPEQVLRYLARYTHRVAISNRRLIACDDNGVTFKWKDYRLEGPERYKLMTLAPHEFIRRFLMHVLPAGFHRIRYYGLLASGWRAENIARARELLALPLLPIAAIKAANANINEPQMPKHPCPCCGGPMIIIEIFQRGCSPHYRPAAPAHTIRIDTS